MCMITYAPPNTPIDPEAILNGAVVNDDGHGFAMIADGALVVRRGLVAESVLEQFMEMRQRHPDGPALFHSRMATHGGVDKSNIHPFYLGNDRRTVIAHNGVFGDIHVPKGENRSDTRLFAERFLPKRPKMSLLTYGGRRKVTKWMGRFNKLVVITTNPRSRGTSFILNEEAGWWDGGCWYSNYDYTGHYMYAKKTVSETDSFWDEYWQAHLTEEERDYYNRLEADTDDTYRSRYSIEWSDAGYTVTDTRACREDDPLSQCSVCEAYGFVNQYGVCTLCNNCNDCQMSAVTCQCF